MEQLYATDELPPVLQTAGTAHKLDMGVAAGLAWMIIRWDPGSEWPPHYTDTIDLDVVLEGTIELVLDDGAHRLEPGDKRRCARCRPRVAGRRRGMHDVCSCDRRGARLTD